MGYALKKETCSSCANRLFPRNSHQGFRRFFGLSHRDVGLRNPRRHWRKRIFLGKLALASRYHGIWGSGDTTWEKFKPMLEAKGFDWVSAVTYSNDESYTKPETLQVVQIKIGEAIKDLRKDEIVGHKVDVVAHSMGGLVMRTYCAQPVEINGKKVGGPDACKKTIRKLITIDTPHRGSELADWLLLHERHRDIFYSLVTLPVPPLSPEEEALSPEKRKGLEQQNREWAKDHCDSQIDTFINNGEAFYLKNVGFHPVGGAVESLATGSVNDTVATGTWVTLSPVVNEVPAHVGVGHLPDVLRLPPFMSADVWWLQGNVLNACGLSRKVIFGGDSDGIVSIGSQTDGLSSYSTNFEDVDHVNVTSKERVVEQVRTLLDEGLDRFSPVR